MDLMRLTGCHLCFLSRATVICTFTLKKSDPDILRWVTVKCVFLPSSVFSQTIFSGPTKNNKRTKMFKTHGSVMRNAGSSICFLGTSTCSRQRGWLAAEISGNRIFSVPYKMGPYDRYKWNYFTPIHALANG